MNNFETLPRAPITEALLDVKVDAASSSSIDTLADFGETLRSNYPNRLVINAAQAVFSLTPSGIREIPEKSELHQSGFRYSSNDGIQVVQARLDGFAFSRLKPYSSWSQVKGEAQRLWAAYVKHTGATSVSRIAVRYINTIEIPLPFSDFREYLLTIPDIAPGLPSGLAQFFMQLVIPFVSVNAIAIVNQTIGHDGVSSTLPLIFDIEVSKTLSVSAVSEDLWGQFEELRKVKNDIFFQSVTSRCLELFR